MVSACMRSDAPFREPLATPCVPTESDRPVASRSRQHAIRAAPGRAYLWGKGGAVVSVCMQSEQPRAELTCGERGGRRGERMHAIRAARAELTGSPKRRRAPYAVVAVLDARDNLLNGGGTSL